MAEPDRYRVFKTSTDYCMYYKHAANHFINCYKCQCKQLTSANNWSLICKLTLVYCVTVVASHCYTSLKIQMIRSRSLHNSREFTTDIVASVCISPDATQQMNILPGRCFVLALADFDHYNMRTVFLS